MNIQINGISLFYQVSGSGEPMLLLHGNGEDHQIFTELAAKLADHYTIYAIDSRNHGQSQKTEDYSYETMVADIYGFIKELNLGKVNLVGFSDGAIIGLMLAMKNPTIIKKMALLGVNLKPEDFTEESYQYVKETYEETKDPLFKLMLEQPNIELEDIHKVHVPTLLIRADNDIFKPETYINLLAALPNASLKIMNGHDHASYIIHQEMLYPHLMDFFSKK
ncbi:alpha/beta fold hydrolase [Candidatus Enterococcus ferrettii]|uniref:AB hydrolase-1 domain-containing protein n=1 Tax=Candidatus Enterococcus ferrettii TaxID=2815324 RepID=A0ABV0EJJ3_9ENTE|nr:alpha/beta hydrolase [Enterococcus sp. 665A]MBO1338491.1 alpha/beta hydrolase [Enterococcus sp. 665A]